MPELVKYIDPHEFRAVGYLQEVNRVFLHPLGLALAVDAVTGAYGVLDARDDPEGFYFDELTASDVARGLKLSVERRERVGKRQAKLGYMIQPLVVSNA